MNVTIPGLVGSRSLPTRNTCDGTDAPVSVRWSGVPRGTAELALFVLNLRPVQEKLFIDWALTGLNPALGGIASGQLPPGAVAGRNGFGRAGYSVCPPKGSSESYVVKVFALPHKLAPAAGANALASYSEAERQATVAGIASFTYRRG